MFLADTSTEKHVHITEALKKEKLSVNEKYFCPLCGGEVVIKHGSVIASHFAHRSLEECDTWQVGKMSKWHIQWQNQFPIESREVVLVKDGIKHRADILIENPNGDKAIIEFQNSSISYEEILERTDFYRNFGTVIWVFQEMKTKTGNLKEIYPIGNTKKLSKYRWKHWKKSLPSPKELANLNSIIFLQIASYDKNLKKTVTKIVQPLDIRYGEWSMFYTFKRTITNSVDFKKNLKYQMEKGDNFANILNFIKNFERHN